MLKKFNYAVLGAVILIFGSCAQLQTVLTQVASQTTGPAPLTTDEVANGLKTALKLGADSSVTRLSKTDGFFKDAALKILLPAEANQIIEKIDMIPGGKKMVADVELRLNRAAEDAAKEAKPILVNAITSMTIADAFGILKGSDTSATHYLRQTTYASLKALFAPKIDASLGKPLVGGISTNTAWNTLTGTWNKVAVSLPGKIAGLTPVKTSLTDYVTEKALQALFVKVAQEEKNIRKEPFKWAIDIIQRVFGTKQ